MRRSLRKIQAARRYIERAEQKRPEERHPSENADLLRDPNYCRRWWLGERVEGMR